MSCFLVADLSEDSEGKSLLFYTRGLTLFWAALSFEKLEEAVTLLAKANRIMELENEIFQDKLSKETPDLLKGTPAHEQVPFCLGGPFLLSAMDVVLQGKSRNFCAKNTFSKRILGIDHKNT